MYFVEQRKDVQHISLKMATMHSFDVVHGQYVHGIQLSVRTGILYRKYGDYFMESCGQD